MHKLLFLIFFLPLLLRGQSEADYQRAIAAKWGAVTEFAVTSGRVDILTDTHAVEVEFAAKWKNSIGQALWYGLQTNREPGIILILKDRSDFKYLQQLQSAIDYAGIGPQIKVWAYPDDFPGLGVSDARAVRAAGGTSDYWLNTNSSPDKRHQRGCRYFANTSKGRYCTATEGVAAGCCH